MKPKMTFLLKSLMLFFFASALFYLSVLSSTNTYLEKETEASVDDPRLTIAVYYESKCDDSGRFINEQISKAVELFSDIINVVFVPYGNANYTWNKEKNLWDFQCQHGPDECFGNLIHNCLIFLRPNFKDHFPFLNCSMAYVKDLQNDVSIQCNHNYPIPIDAIMECANGQKGNALLYSSALLTDRLVPKKIWVPWIVINNVHTDSIQKDAESDIVKLICNTYKGPKKLSACQ